MKDDIPAYSEGTKTTYPNWAALIEAEANGYVVVAIISREAHDNKAARSWPYVVGPMSEADAEKVRRRLRSKWNRPKERARYPHLSFQFFVRPAWKDMS